MIEMEWVNHRMDQKRNRSMKKIVSNNCLSLLTYENHHVPFFFLSFASHQHLEQMIIVSSITMHHCRTIDLLFLIFNSMESF